jgi:alpha-L-fucosidase
MLKGMKSKIEYAQFLHDASEIQITAPRGHWLRQQLAEEDVNLLLPVVKPDVEIPVIEVFLRE